MTSRLGHELARTAGYIRIPWRDFAPFYRHMKRLHGGAYTRMLVSGQKHSAMDVLEHLVRTGGEYLYIYTGGREGGVEQ